MGFDKRRIRKKGIIIMKFTVLRTVPGKYSGMDRNGDMYFTDDEDVVVEYEYDAEDFWNFLFDYKNKDKYIKDVITYLIENPDSLEELVEEVYADKFSRWLDKEREE
jgi:flagellar basal body-associated protein FliL